MNKILVITVTYNAMKWAERCFSSLRNSKIVSDIFVVDNGSTDGTQTYIKEKYPEVILTESDSNLGFCKANNIGLQYALDKGYDYVYLLNQDAWVMPDTFEKLIDAAKQHPEYGILSPIQMKADMEHLDNNFVKNVICNLQRVEPYLVEDLYFNRKKDVYEVSFVMAAHWLITKKCLETVGGFSPSFYHYGEDENYIDRVSYWHFKAGIVTDIIGVHDRGNPIWSEEKNEYIREYVKPIKNASNPIERINIKRYAIINVLKDILKGKRRRLNYLSRLYKEANKIEENYKISLKPKAFLA